VGSRRKGRELAVQMLYQWDIDRQPVRVLLESFGRLGEQPESARTFGRRLVEGTLSHLPEIDALIEAHAENWRLSRMAAVDRSVLRLAVYEFLREQTPKRVVINEALEIAKKYSSAEAAQFVNGVLDAVRARLEAPSEAR
jgi:N utilization substance protein B